MRVRRFRPQDVTTRAAECEPHAVQMSSDDVDAIWHRVVRLYETRLHPAIALCVRRSGRVIIDRAIGHVRGNQPNDPLNAPLVPATPNTLFSLFSASKMITAMVIHLLIERGKLRVDERIAHYIPEFGCNGKEQITLKQVLTHRAGISVQPPGTNLTELITVVEEPSRLLDLLAELKPTSTPGHRLAYHALTGGYVLSALVAQVTGRDVRTYLREEILAPLGFANLSYGVTADKLDQVAKNGQTGLPPIPPLSTLFRSGMGVSWAQACEMSNNLLFLTSIVPSGNCIGTANEACRFMQLLLNDGELDGVRVFAPHTIQQAIAEQSYLEFDKSLGFPFRYGMGFMLGARYVSLYGAGTTSAFGHLGFTHIVVCADPERDVSYALMTSGKPLMSVGHLPWLRLIQTIARVCPRDWGRG